MGYFRVCPCIPIPRKHAPDSPNDPTSKRCRSGKSKSTRKRKRRIPKDFLIIEERLTSDGLASCPTQNFPGFPATGPLRGDGIRFNSFFRNNFCAVALVRVNSHRFPNSKRLASHQFPNRLRCAASRFLTLQGEVLGVCGSQVFEIKVVSQN
jgi:hypothetical protein